MRLFFYLTQLFENITIYKLFWRRVKSTIHFSQTRRKLLSIRRTLINNWVILNALKDSRCWNFCTYWIIWNHVTAQFPAMKQICRRAVDSKRFRSCRWLLHDRSLRFLAHYRPCAGSSFCFWARFTSVTLPLYPALSSLLHSANASKPVSQCVPFVSSGEGFDLALATDGSLARNDRSHSQFFVRLCADRRSAISHM